mmetsp:Transcript_110558/g.191630  ORF Transcript_110558/g.191630 Transcript_110558/m.191630 type:complete len:106 (-) Transcript_110558:257-574(-)
MFHMTVRYRGFNNLAGHWGFDNFMHRHFTHDGRPSADFMYDRWCFAYFTYDRWRFAYFTYMVIFMFHMTVRYRGFNNLAGHWGCDNFMHRHFTHGGRSADFTYNR